MGGGERLMDDPVITALAAKYNKTSAQILLRNLLQRGIIVLPKSTNSDRIKQNIEVIHLWISVSVCFLSVCLCVFYLFVCMLSMFICVSAKRAYVL